MEINPSKNWDFSDINMQNYLTALWYYIRPTCKTWKFSKFKRGLRDPVFKWFFICCPGIKFCRIFSQISVLTHWSSISLWSVFFWWKFSLVVSLEINWYIWNLIIVSLKFKQATYIFILLLGFSSNGSPENIIFPDLQKNESQFHSKLKFHIDKNKIWKLV